VLYYGEEPCAPCTDWTIWGNPVGFLIDPQGYLFSRRVGALTLEELIELYENVKGSPQAPIGVATAASLAGEAKSLDIEVSASEGSVLVVEVDCRWVDMTFDAEGQLVDVARHEPRPAAAEWSQTVTLNASGKALLRLTLDPQDYEGLEYSVSVAELPASGAGFRNPVSSDGGTGGTDDVAVLRGGSVAEIPAWAWRYQGGEFLFIGEAQFRERNELQFVRER
jgi:hypothetical protein